MQSTEIIIRGRKYTMNRKVLVLALVHAGRDVERTRRVLIHLVTAYERYLHRQKERRKHGF